MLLIVYQYHVKRSINFNKCNTLKQDVNNGGKLWGVEGCVGNTLHLSNYTVNLKVF